ncbi:MAG: type II toxin-antitoxin system prevent-host-death family antitoxin [Aggregatilineales bacterium]
MMKLRQQAGEVVNQTYYRGRSFVVERAGIPVAVIIPPTEYDDLQRMKREARNDFFAMTEQLRERLAQSGATEEELQAEITEAIAQVRAEDARTRSHRNS